jgi:hypothetical protein
MVPKELNTRYIQWHLREAAGAIESILTELERNPNERIDEFSVTMRLLYHHVNTAWNARYATSAEADECSEGNFLRWARYPSDLKIW